MKPTSISAEALFEAHREAMRWEWIAGHAHPERRFDDAAVRDARSAADLVNQMDEDDLANVLYELAQERYSRRIARKIAEQRRISPINSTGRLADVVRSAIGRSHEKIDPATRTFLALRMAVNQELEKVPISNI